MPRILVVDDDPDVVEACRMVLEREGYDVSEANNRLDGMAQCAEVKPDLIILDVMMDQPDDGIVMAQQLRYEGNKTPILMLTSVNKAIGLELGVDDEVVPVSSFCEKPIEPAMLIRQVADILEQGGAA
jgi:DNA-binding response OmpR family regulator